MDLIDKEHGIFIGLELLENSLKPLLEVAAVFRSRQQGPHVKRVDRGRLKHLGDLAFRNSKGQTFCDGCFPDPCLTNKQGIVLATPAENLNNAFHFMLSADEWVDFSSLC